MLWPPPRTLSSRPSRAARSTPPRRRARTRLHHERRARVGHRVPERRSPRPSRGHPAGARRPRGDPQRLHVAGAERGAAVPVDGGRPGSSPCSRRHLREARLQRGDEGLRALHRRRRPRRRRRRAAASRSGRSPPRRRRAGRRGRGGPRSRHVGTAIRSRSCGGIGGHAERLQRRADGREHARGAGAVEVVGLERRPGRPHARHSPSRSWAQSRQRWRWVATCGSAMKRAEGLAHRRLRCERREAEAVHQHELAQRPPAARRRAGPRSPRPGGGRRRPAARRRSRRSARRARRRGGRRRACRPAPRTARGPAGRARSRGGRAPARG